MAAAIQPAPPPQAPPEDSLGATATSPLPRERSTNARWLGLLTLTAAAVALGTGLTLRGAAQLDQEQLQLGREVRLQTALTEIASQLRQAELSQAAFIGTGRLDYAKSFRTLHQQLSQNLGDLRAPQNFSALQKQRLAQLPQQAQPYLEQLEHAARLREQGNRSEAMAALEATETQGISLQNTVELVLGNSKRESALREQSLRLENQRQRAEAVTRAAIFTLVLLGAYLLFRAERRFAGQRVRTLQRENERLRELSEEDGLTKLNNRRAFDSRMDSEWQRAHRYKIPLSLVILDVDHFKSYNDTFGHPAGDVILRQMANALAQTARLSDTVARYGGEEFALILPHTDAHEAMIVGERLRALILRSEWPNRAITASIGVATLTPEMTTPALLVDAADTALYYAKEHGRNQVRHYSAQES
jgi:diguanylate cyclase (GGDEF)-like protein